MKQGSERSEALITLRTAEPLHLAEYQITVTLNFGLSVSNRSASHAASTQNAGPTQTRLVSHVAMHSTIPRPPHRKWSGELPSVQQLGKKVVLPRVHPVVLVPTFL